MNNLPSISIRFFSDDQYQLDKVFYSNSYKLRGIQDKEKAPIVIDLGAGFGDFTLTSLLLGAKKIYSIEGFIENFKVLLENVGKNNNVIPYLLAISKDKNPIYFGHPKPDKKTYIDFSNIEPYTSSKHNHFSISTSETLDNFLESYIQEPMIDILKINIGFQERDILKTSKLIETKVKNICGETILEPEYVATFKSEMSAKGFINSHIITYNEEDNKIFFIFSKGDIEEYFNL